MQERSIEAQKQAQLQFNDYVKSVSTTGTPAQQIEHAKQLLDAGTITQDEFNALKAKALA